VSPSYLLNTDFKVEMSVSDMTLPLRDAAPGLAEGAADVHDARTKAAAITAVIQASRDLRPRRRATGIPTLFPRPEHDPRGRRRDRSPGQLAARRTRQEPHYAAARKVLNALCR